jgi:hypothetical protein
VGGSLAARWALKRSSIAFAPRLSTGRNSLRYTFSVVRVLACPTRCAMSSIGIPALDSSETKLCRSSRGVHSSASSPASSATWRKARRTLAASRGVPSCVVKTRWLSGHRAALRMRLWVCQRLCARSATTQLFGSARVRRDSRVLVSPPSRTDRHSLHARRFAVEVRMAPGQRPQFLRSCACEQRNHDVGMHGRVFLRGR